MKYLFVIYFLVNGAWVRGDDMPQEGWASLMYEDKAACVATIARAEQLQADLKQKNPRAYDKKFVCEPFSEPEQ